MEKGEVVKLMITAGLKQVAPSGGAEIGFVCPDPKHNDNKPSASLNYEKGVWYCYGCGAKGTMAKLLGVRGPRRAAARTITDALARRQAQEREVLLPADFEPLTRPNRYLKRRRVRPATVKTFRLGVAGDYVIFPAYYRGRLTGWQGRAMTPGREPRYAGVEGAGDYVFGYDQTVRRRGPVVVVEGPFDALRVWQAGFASIALLGGGSEARLGMVAELQREVVVLPDNDEGGERMAERALSLAARLRVRVARLNTKDPDESTEAEIKSAITRARR